MKYSLGKKPASQVELELPLPYDRTKPKWNESQLQIGDWFSQINYYIVKDPGARDDDTVMVCTQKNTKDAIKMSRDILEYEMNSGNIYEKEERVSRTELVRIFTNAK